MLTGTQVPFRSALLMLWLKDTTRTIAEEGPEVSIHRQQALFLGAQGEAGRQGGRVWRGTQLTW